MKSPVREGAGMTNEESFRAGYVALVGRPNVGKSTLMNALLGQKVAAVSPRPQTTRQRQLGILTTDEAQIVFMDTPGIHKPVHKLGEFMNQVAEDTLKDADLILWLVEANNNPTPEDTRIADKLREMKDLPPLVLAVNKLDLTGGYDLSERLDKIQRLYPQGKLMQFSASTGAGLDQLLAEILKNLPEGEPFFDPDQVTDYYERDIAAELIREAALLNLREEIPHGVAVRIDDFEEREDGSAYIHATLFVERESHKGIVIGKGGEMMKKIGSSARKEIEDMSGRKAFLDLRVKVNQNWRNKPDALRWLGYVRDKE
jgi:GTP-binding protein Era